MRVGGDGDGLMMVNECINASVYDRGILKGVVRCFYARVCGEESAGL